MSDVVAGGAPAPEQPAQSPAEPVKAEVKPVVETPKADPLAKVIEQARLDRQAKAQREAEANSLKAEKEKLAAEVEQLRKSQAFEDDPVAYGKARGWDKDTQALIGQILLYDLVPDKAPPDLRLKLFEMRQARKEQEQTKAQKEAAERAAMEANKRSMDEYAGAMMDSIKSLDMAAVPESGDYFGDDHESYHKSLLATAMNMAREAAQAGQVADLRPANVAKVLEAEVARRLQARDQRVAARKPKQVDSKTVPVKDGVKQSPLEVVSSNGMTGQVPRPPAMTEAERIARAVEAGWRNK